MAFEQLPAIKAIVAALSADTDLMAQVPGGVHLFLAEQGTPFPYIVISPTTQVDIYGMGATRGLSMPLLLVKILSEGTSPAPIEGALSRLDEVLSEVRGQVDDHFVQGVTREPRSAILYVETRTDSSHIVHCGGTYRAHLSQIA